MVLSSQQGVDSEAANYTTAKLNEIPGLLPLLVAATPYECRFKHLCHECASTKTSDVTV